MQLQPMLCRKGGERASHTAADPAFFLDKNGDKKHPSNSLVFFFVLAVETKN